MRDTIQSEMALTQLRKSMLETEETALKALKNSAAFGLFDDKFLVQIAKKHAACALFLLKAKPGIFSEESLAEIAAKHSQSTRYIVMNETLKQKLSPHVKSAIEESIANRPSCHSILNKIK